MLGINLQRETALGTGCLFLVEKLVPPQRFSFKFIVCHVTIHNDYESICAFLPVVDLQGKSSFRLPKYTNHTGLH